jgi:hypothetical protein
MTVEPTKRPVFGHFFRISRHDVPEKHMKDTKEK